MTNRRDLEAIYPLTPLQKGMLFHSLYEPQSGLYFEQLTCTLSGPLDVPALQRAWEHMLERHSILRTAFVWKGQREPLQAVHRKVSLPWHEEDWRHLDTPQQQTLLERWLEADRLRGFELNRAPLIRITLLRLGETRWTLVWSHHHLLMDGWSLPVVMKDLFAAYATLVQGQPLALPPTRPFQDFIRWLERHRQEKGDTFWRDQLSGASLPTSLGIEHPAVGSGGHREVWATLSAAETSRLQDTARRHQVTLSTLTQAAWAIVLSRYARTPDVTFGITLAGRPADLAGADAMVGLFINSIPLRIEVREDLSVGAFLQHLQRLQSELQTHQHASLLDIRRAIAPPGSLSAESSGQAGRSALFESLLVFENYPLSSAVPPQVAGLEVSDIQFTEQTNIPLTLAVIPGPELRIKLTFDERRLPAQAAERLPGHLGSVLRGLCTHATLRDIPLLTREERKRWLERVGSAGPSLELPKTDSLTARFEQQAALRPDAIVVSVGSETVAGQDTLTWRELSHRSNQLAWLLMERGVQPGERVGMYLERSCELLVTLLGILKAGAAYVPLDPDYPLERLEFLLQDSQVRCVVTRSSLAERLPGGDNEPQRVLLDVDQAELLSMPTALPDVGAEPERPAYVIYTSGSTGRPKGCVVSHRNVIRLFTSTEAWFGFGPDDVWTLFHSIAFDFSVWELWGALLYGGRLVVVPWLTSRNPEAFHHLLRDEGVTVLNQTPSAFRQLMRVVGETPEVHCPALRYVIFGGEALEPTALLPWLERYGDQKPRLVNMYGITETTVHVTYRPITWDDALSRRGSPIGVPIPDLRLYLLDDRLEPTPDGVVGELFVGGEGVSLGYLRRPELTRERFLPDPFSARPGARMYRSGDLARRTEDGELEYLGRADQQLKIRGFRIEPGEIEAALLCCPGVLEALVAAHGSGADTRLAAWLVLGSPAPPLTEIRKQLEDQLPDYMVPAYLVPMERIPLTVHGKVDRAALPDPTVGSEQPESYVAPRTPDEQAMAEVWAEVLELERVGVRDSFFALGGDSIRSLSLIAKMRAKGLEVTLAQLFESPTIEALAVGARSSAGAAAALGEPFDGLTPQQRAALPEEIEDAWPMTQLQRGMVFHSVFTPGSTLYQDTFSYHLEVPFTAEHLVEAARVLTPRHPSLRLSFDLDAEVPISRVHRQADLSIRIDDLSGLEEEQQQARIDAFLAEESSSPVDLGRPLIRATVHIRSPKTLQLTLHFHHAMLDGWSLAVILQEWLDEAIRLSGGTVNPLPPPAPPAFRALARLERETLADAGARAFWRKQLDDCPLTAVPRFSGADSDATAHSGEDSHGVRRRYAIRVEGLLLDRLQRMARRLDVPVKTLLLAGWVRVLALVSGGMSGGMPRGMSGQRQVCLGLVVNGRPEWEGADRATGLFLNTVPLRVTVPDGSWIALVRTVARTEQALLPYRRFPLAEIQRLAGGKNLLETTFNFVQFHVLNRIGTDDRIRVLGSTAREETNFPLAFTASLVPDGSQLTLDFSADRGVLDDFSLEQLAGSLVAALDAMAQSPEASCLRVALLPSRDVAGLEVLEIAEDAALSMSVGNGDDAFPLAERIAQKGLEAPLATAVIAPEGTLSRSQLEHRAEVLKRRLMAAGVGPGTRVALCFARSLELVVAMLATWKSGAAYVPIDPEYPLERQRYMVRDCGAAVLLTHRPAGALLEAALGEPDAAGETAPSSGRPVVWYLDENEGLSTHFTIDAGASAENRSSPDDPAYVLYTSGTTGQPKGVVIPHRAIANHMDWMLEAFPMGPGDAVLQKTSVSFDASVWEFWAPLLSGAVLVLATPGVQRDPEAMLEEVRRHRITVLQLVPTVLEHIALTPQLERCDGLRLLFVGGEALAAAPVRAVQARLPALTVINLYGPAEATIDATAFVCPPGWQGAGQVPIGHPIRGVQAYVLDPERQRVPAGLPGELYLGGAGLALGYLDRPALTAERFVEIEVSGAGSSRHLQRLYRTGDRARFLQDGALEFLGRLDDQVKLGGRRVEPGEVRSALAGHPEVAQCAVVAREGAGGRMQLVAYVVARTGPEAAPSGLEESLRTRSEAQLPAYMCPSAYVFLPALPIGPGGKLDRAALPAPAPLERVRTETPVTRARSVPEVTLAAVWREILGIEEVGPEDDFFALGGDSIASLQVVSRLRSRGFYLTPSQLFTHRSLERIAAVMQPIGQDRGKTSASHLGAETSAEPDEIPLTPVQKRFFALEPANPHHFNQSLLLEVPPDFDAGAFEASLRTAGRRHDALRLRFERTASGWRQFLIPMGDERQQLSLETLDLAEAEGLSPASFESEETASARLREAIERQVAQLQAGLNITTGPVFRAVWLRCGPERRGRLALVAHHLVIDAVAWRVLLEELATGYAAHHAGVPLQPIDSEPIDVSTPFYRYAQWMEASKNAPELEASRRFWESLEPPPGPPRLPDPTNTHANAQLHLESLSEAETARLSGAALRLRCTIEELLLTALARALPHAPLTGHSDRATWVALEGHGRDLPLDAPDVARTVGWFTQIHPVRLEVDPGESAHESLRRVKEQVRTARRHGRAYDLFRMSSSASTETKAGGLERLEPEISVNYLGQLGLQADAGSVFSAAHEAGGPTSAPENRRDFLLDLVALTEAGKLRAQWIYASTVYPAETIARAAGAWKEALLELAEAMPAKGQTVASPSDFPLAEATQQELDLLLADRSDVEDILPLTPLQEGLLLLTLRDPEANHYLQQYQLELEGEPDLEALARAWNGVLARHAALRSSFHLEDLRRPLQLIHSGVTCPFTQLDWRGLTSAELETRWLSLCAQDRAQGFQLDHAPLMRITVVRRAERHYRLLWTHHHLMLDGWSVPIVLKEVLEAWGCSENVTHAPAFPYARFIEWHQQQDPKQVLEGWRALLQGFGEPNRFELSPPPAPAPGSSSHEEVAREVSTLDSERMRRFARTEGVTLNTLVQGAWSLLVGRYSGQDDVVFGVTMSGRPVDLPGVEALVGMCINTLPMRIDLSACPDIHTLLHTLQTRQRRMSELEACRLGDLHRLCGLPAGHELFESAVIFENYPVDQALSQAGGALAGAGVRLGGISSAQRTHLPLALYVMPGSRLELRLVYDRARFDVEQITRLLEQLEYLLQQLATRGLAQWRELELMPVARAWEVFGRWNEATQVQTPDTPLHTFVQEHARSRPEATAIACRDQRVTWLELDQRSARLAAALRARGVGPGTLVGLCMERSCALVIGLLGILRAGGAYVPLDPDFPPERLSIMLEDSGAAWILTHGEGGKARLPAEIHSGVTVLELNPLLEVLPGSDAGADPSVDEIAVDPASPAYVIFTSGSTGRPKGVEISRRALMNCLHAFASRAGLGTQDSFLAVTTIAFDIAGLELFLPLLTGATLVVAAGEETLDGELLKRRLESSACTAMQATPASWRLLIEADWHPRPGFRAWCGGEALPLDLAEALLERKVALWNVYGPTETTIWSMVGEIKTLTDARFLGAPIANTRLYVVDQGLNPVPAEVPGELLIGGYGLATGYWRRETLTQERFIRLPWMPGERVYRTGDRVRYDALGRIRFLGREDSQLKIRGFRVEPGEIEYVLQQQPGIRQAAVTVWERAPGDRQLVGYVVPTGPEEEDSRRTRLQAALRQRLPAYMVPSLLVMLEAMPLTPNGKIDRRALPAPGLEAGDDAPQRVAPRTPVEEALTELWQDSLGLERVGVTWRFFDAGGHSLHLTRLASRIRRVFQLEIPIRVLFEAQTIEAQAAWLEAGETVPGRTRRLAGAFLRLRRMSPEELEQLRQRAAAAKGK